MKCDLLLLMWPQLYPQARKTWITVIYSNNNMAIWRDDDCPKATSPHALPAFPGPRVAMMEGTETEACCHKNPGVGLPYLSVDRVQERAVSPKTTSFLVKAK